LPETVTIVAAKGDYTMQSVQLSQKRATTVASGEDLWPCITHDMSEDLQHQHGHCHGCINFVLKCNENSLLKDMMFAIFWQC